MSSVISIALPVFAVIAAGMAAGRLGVLAREDVGALNRFVFNFAMPAALFSLMANAPPPTAGDLAYAGCYAGAAVAVIFSAYALARRAFALAPEDAGAHAFASTLGNAVFLGLPIALAVPGWAENFVILMLAEGIVVIAIGAAMMAPRGAGAPGEILVKPFQNPLVVAMLSGLGFSFAAAALGGAMPGPAATFLEILGRAAGPTALFSLGLFLAVNPAPDPRAVAGKVGAIAVMKMAATPALTLSALALFGMRDPLQMGPAALFTFTPTAVGAFVMANRYGRYVAETAAAVAVTTALSVLSISAVLAIFA